MASGGNEDCVDSALTRTKKKVNRFLSAVNVVLLYMV